MPRPSRKEDDGIIGLNLAAEIQLQGIYSITEGEGGHEQGEVGTEKWREREKRWRITTEHATGKAMPRREEGHSSQHSHDFPARQLSYSPYKLRYDKIRLERSRAGGQPGGRKNREERHQGIYTSN